MTSFRLPLVRIVVLLLAFHVMRGVDLTRVGGAGKYVFAVAWLTAVLIVISFTPLKKERL